MLICKTYLIKSIVTFLVVISLWWIVSFPRHDSNQKLNKTKGRVILMLWVLHVAQPSGMILLSSIWLTPCFYTLHVAKNFPKPFAVLQHVKFWLCGFQIFSYCIWRIHHKSWFYITCDSHLSECFPFVFIYCIRLAPCNDFLLLFYIARGMHIVESFSWSFLYCMRLVCCWHLTESLYSCCFYPAVFTLDFFHA